MHQLIRLLRLRSQLRYWRQRALAAEDRLEAETWRNRNREDMFVSATVMGSRGMFGVSPRVGPAQLARPAQQLPLLPQQMTGAEQLEFNTLWLPDALQSGISRQQAEQDFLIEVAKRKTLNDDPYSN